MKKMLRFRTTARMLFFLVIGVMSAGYASAQYCTPTYTTGCGVGDQILNFSTTGGATNITNNNTACGAGSYTFYSAMGCSQIQGLNVTLNMQAGPVYGQGFRVWIDWNGDGDFADLGEDVYVSPASNTAINTTTITVPFTAIPGTTRMRVMCTYASIPAAGTYCSTGVTYGETEDYPFTVIASTPCAGAPVAGTAVTSATPVCPAETFQVSLTGNTLASGLTYQWMSSADNITYTNIAGATSSSYATTTAMDMWYKAAVTCTGSALSDTSAAVQVTVNSFLNCYCTSNATSTADEEIVNVTMGNLNNSSACGDLGGPGSSSAQYSDYTNTTPATTIPFLVQGVTYPSSVEIGTCGSFPYNNGTKVWIDYNHNGDFSDIGEEVYFGQGNGNHVESFSLVVPATAMTGNTRMRIVTVENGNAGNINPCGTYTWGETEDYFVNIVAPLVNDAGIDAFVTPVLPTCNFADSVRVALTNYGSDTLTSATIQWSHNGLPEPLVTWSGSLPSFSTVTVTLGLVPLAPGSSLLAYTQLPNGVVEMASGSWNDSASIANLLSGLSGNYTIGGTTPDYVDFASAVSDLNTFGTCGPVVFDVRDGIYNEQMQLNDLPSLDAANTVTFRAENGDPSLVTMSYAATGTGDNYVIQMNGGDFYRIENMTLENTATIYAHVLNFLGGCDSNHFEGNIMTAANANNTSTNAAIIYSNNTLDNGNHFINNTIEGGSYGLYFYGSGTTSSEAGTVIEGNHFFNNYIYGMRLQYQDGVVIKDNVIDGGSTYTGTRYALYASYLNQSPQIIGNNIKGEANSGWRYGIYWFNGGGTAANFGRVENNMVSVGYNGNTSTCYGLYMSNTGYMNVYHNTFLASQGGTGTRVLYIPSGGGHKVKNNIIANYTGGYGFYLNNAFAVAESDYNVIHSPAGNAGYFGGIQQTLTDWQSATSFDANSLDNNPMFFSSLDLHVCNDTIGNQGTPIASITTDIDGQMRDAAFPDMGADEFSGLTGSFLGSDVDVCTGDSIMLQAGSPTDTTLWSTGDTTAFIWVTTPGTYTVTINSACGTGTDAIVVNQSAQVYAGYVVTTALEFCNGDSVLLYSSQMADTYQWSGGSTATTDSIYATTGGNYTLNIADGCGSGSETVVVTMNDVPTAAFTSDTSYLTGNFTNTSTSVGNTTYLWDFGDGMTSTDQDPIHVYGATGMYTVTLTVTNDCGTSTTTSVVTIAIAGIEELGDIGTLNVYPNPSTGLFQLDIDVNETMNLDIVVTNVMGQKLLVQSLSTINGSQTESIDLSNEADGVYYLNISSEGTLLTTRMIIKK